MLDVLYTYGPTGFSGRAIYTYMPPRPLRWLLRFIVVSEPCTLPSVAPDRDVRRCASMFIGLGWQGRNVFISRSCPLGWMLNLLLPPQPPRPPSSIEV